MFIRKLSINIHLLDSKFAEALVTSTQHLDEYIRNVVQIPREWLSEIKTQGIHIAYAQLIFTSLHNRMKLQKYSPHELVLVWHLFWLFCSTANAHAKHKSRTRVLYTIKRSTFFFFSCLFKVLTPNLFIDRIYKQGQASHKEGRYLLREARYVYTYTSKFLRPAS